MPFFTTGTNTWLNTIREIRGTFFSERVLNAK